MTFPIATLIALSGTALLAFLTGLHLQKNRIRSLAAKCKELAARLRTQAAELDNLIAERDACQISVNNLKRLLEDYESRVLQLQSEKLAAQPHNGNGKKVNGERMPKPVEVVREVEVIREIPVLVCKDELQTVAQQKKADRLVQAFKKGVEMESRQGASHN
ncbi:MAG: hypothetical protein ACE5FF_14780 [Saprospiraceae bacterium]